ncbi:hypothetical protein JOB18_047812 [Solea senegalensis]|uniref:Uncharacterized protein n=1 Tax=Solea senegalensis TaxID=28829 RepID=A0AAV6RFL5_SOLSE|nr:hypothetical protein JOB18_047812 [Solea senegalensis]
MACCCPVVQCELVLAPVYRDPIKMQNSEASESNKWLQQWQPNLYKLWKEPAENPLGHKESDPSATQIPGKLAAPVFFGCPLIALLWLDAAKKVLKPASSERSTRLC